jgi:hypothetical protein
VLPSSSPSGITRLYLCSVEAYLASGKDGYDVFKDSRMIMDEECAPLIPNLVSENGFFGAIYI